MGATRFKVFLREGARTLHLLTCASAVMKKKKVKIVDRRKKLNSPCSGSVQQRWKKKDMEMSAGKKRVELAQVHGCIRRDGRVAVILKEERLDWVGQIFSEEADFFQALLQQGSFDVNQMIRGEPFIFHLRKPGAVELFLGVPGIDLRSTNLHGQDLLSSLVVKGMADVENYMELLIQLAAMPVMNVRAAILLAKEGKNLWALLVFEAMLLEPKSISSLFQFLEVSRLEQVYLRGIQKALARQKLQAAGVFASMLFLGDGYVALDTEKIK